METQGCSLINSAKSKLIMAYDKAWIEIREYIAVSLSLFRRCTALFFVSVYRNDHFAPIGIQKGTYTHVSSGTDPFALI